MWKLEIKANQNLQFNISSINDAGYFSGYASIFNHIDDHKDVVHPGAFSSSLERWESKNTWPKMLWQHNQKEPIGYWTFMEEDRKGLYVEGQLLLDVQKASEAYALMKAKAVDGLSIGYRVIKATREGKSNIRHIYEVELLEVSVVTFAANQLARVIGIKQEQGAEAK